MKNKKLKIITGLFILFIILIVIIADTGARSFFTFMKYVPGGDYTGHFFLMGMFSFLLNMCLSASTIRFFSISILKGSFIVWVIITIEEISQIFFKYRSFSIGDLVCDYCGIVCFGYIAARICAKTGKDSYENS